jgi:8-oxo-dGTP pyrophosphatase MutT (NUDIX family)
MEVIGEKTLWEGSFIKTVLLTYKDRNGTARDWEAVGRVDCSGVVVMVPVTVNGEVIFIRQYRPVVDSYVIELPAGLVHRGEDTASAGKRELLEETGHASESFVPLIEGVMSTGINTETWNVFMALNAREVSEELRRAHPPDDNEDIEVIKVPLDDVYDTLAEYAESGSKIDLRVFGLIELARRRLEAGQSG